MPRKGLLASPQVRLISSFAAVALVVLGVFLVDILDSRRLVLERVGSSSEDLCRLLAERIDGSLRESGTPDARSAGAAVFVRELDALTLGNGRFVAIVDGRGGLIMRRPGSAGSLGEGEGELRRLIAGIAESGRNGSMIRSETSEYFYSALEGERDFVVIVGESRASVLAEWRRKAVAYAASFAAIAALMIALSLSIARDLAQGTQMAARLVAVESASDMIVIADLEGRAEYVNPSFERITGIPRAAAIGSRSAVFGTESAAADAALHAAAKGESWRGEIIVADANGGERVEEVTLAPVLGPDGSPRRVVAVKRDATERSRLQERLKKLAHYDSLTGLPNRALFFDRLSGAVARGKREGRKFALLFIDLDGFKGINDSYGHHAGDELLSEIARRLRASIRDSDTAGRVGGDEFIVLLDNIAKSEDASVFSAKVGAALSEPVCLPSGDIVSIGASVGVSVYPDDGEDADAMLNAADASMYERKMKRGKRR